MGSCYFHVSILESKFYQHVQRKTSPTKITLFEGASVGDTPPHLENNNILCPAGSAAILWRSDKAARRACSIQTQRHGRLACSASSEGYRQQPPKTSAIPPWAGHLRLLFWQSSFCGLYIKKRLRWCDLANAFQNICCLLISSSSMAYIARST